MSDYSKEILLEKIRTRCPDVVTRKMVEKLTFGLIKAKTMSNKDCLGEGPALRIKFGKTVGYPREAFLAWIEEKLVVEHV